jgi:protein SCO1/2
VKRTGLIIACAALAIAAVDAGLAWRGVSRLHSPAPSAIGGPFHLTDDNGRPVDQSLLKDKWSVVYFGYTFCPDVCPTTLAALGQAIARLGTRASDIQVVFITVDPGRDTPTQLKAYLASPSFPAHAVGLTGSEVAIKAVAGEYHVYYARHGSGEDYSVDHTSILYLMDPEGRFVQPIAVGPPAAMAAQITSAMASG